MKRNRESKYRQKTINYLHKNKLEQKHLDRMVKKYSVTYFEMYQFAVKHNFSYSRDMISKMIEYEMGDTFKLFGDMSKLPLELFEQINSKRPYYLGVDFAIGNDRTGRIMFNGKENK